MPEATQGRCATLLCSSGVLRDTGRYGEAESDAGGDAVFPTAASLFFSRFHGLEVWSLEPKNAGGPC